jgi:signal transduction histidine kinase
MNQPEHNGDLPFSQEQYAFLRTMGHELRTPLNSIVATSEMMVNAVYGELQPGQARAAQRVLRNGARLTTLINAVMLYIRTRADALELRCVPLSLLELLGKELDQHRAAANAKGVALELVVKPGTDETVSGDPEQIAFMLNELLTNAVTFTPSGSIQIQVANAMPGRWSVTITDTGCGIEPENIPRVFDAFWRGREAKQYSPEGSGLGLAIVREFIRLMDGKIEFQSQPGKGTIVTVTLPRVIAAMSPRPGVTSQPAPAP